MLNIPRTRQTDSREAYPITWQGHNGTTNFYGQVTGGTIGRLKTIRDEPHPGYKHARQRGNIVMGDLVLSVWEREVVSGSCADHNNNNSYVNTLSGDLISCFERKLSPPSLTADLTVMKQIALAKCYAKVNAAPVLGGEILSDLDKTLSMFRRPFQGATKLLTKMERTRGKRLSRISNLGKKSGNYARATAESWLEHRYGWTPVLMDMDTITMACYKVRNQWDRQYLVVRAEEKTSRDATTSIFRVALDGSLSGWLATGSVQSSQQMKAAAGIIFDHKGQTTADHVQNLLGLRPSDAPATIWETIPYSFVVDWFVNVGDWIQAITPVPGINIRGKWVTSVEQFSGSYSGTCIIPDAVSSCSGEITGSAGSSLVKTSTVTRDTKPVLTNTPVLKVKSLSILQQADAGALMLKPILVKLKSFRH